MILSKVLIRQRWRQFNFFWFPFSSHLWWLSWVSTNFFWHFFQNRLFTGLSILGRRFGQNRVHCWSKILRMQQFESEKSQKGATDIRKLHVHDSGYQRHRRWTFIFQKARRRISFVALQETQAQLWIFPTRYLLLRRHEQKLDSSVPLSESFSGRNHLY